MALFHFHVTQVSRGHGQSVMESAAYRSGMALYSAYYGETYDFTNKPGVVYSEILLPDHAPGPFRDRQTLWDCVEQVEKHPKAQLAYSFDIALQNELDMKENICLARDYLLKNFVSKGMICDLAVHLPPKEAAEEPNPHFHVLCPIRPLNADGSWGAKQRRVYLLDEHGERIRDKNGKEKFNAVPTTDWGNPETLDHWRKQWAYMVNERLAEKGLEVRIDYRSYEETGSPLIPQVHEGPAASRMESRGVPNRKAELNRFIGKTNRMMEYALTQLEQLRTWIASIGKALSEYEAKRQKPLTEMVLDYYDHRDRVAEGFSRGRNKAKLTNLKKKAAVISFMQERGIHSSGDLDAEIRRIHEKWMQHKRNIYKKKQTESLYKKHLVNAKAIEETKPIFEKSLKLFFSGGRKKYQEANTKELRRYHVAQNYFKKHGIVYQPELRQKWEMLLEREQAALSTALSGYAPLKEDLKQLTEIRKAVDFALGKTDSDGLPQNRSFPEKTALETSPERGSSRNRASVREKLETNQQILNRERMKPRAPKRTHEAER